MPIQAPQWTDFLNCPVCCRGFTPTSRSPVSLACGHTICRHCLVHLHRKQCPFDQTPIDLDPGRMIVNTALLQLAGFPPPAQPYHPHHIATMSAENRAAYDSVVGSIEELGTYLQYSSNGAGCGSRLSRPMQRKLVTLIQCAIAEEEGRGRALRAARSLGERTVSELILLHQNPQQLTINLWAAVRTRGCQFLGPAMQEEVLKLVLLALEDGSALSRKVLVMFVVQRLEQHFPQASKTSIGHVVQLLYRASCFRVSKRESDSSLMRLKDEFRTYEALRREHDVQIVQIATEASLHIAPDQWSALLYGDTTHKSHMQSIIDKLQTPQSFAQSVQELTIALQRTGDPAQLAIISPHLDQLAAIDQNAECPSLSTLSNALQSLKVVVAGLVHYTGQRNNRDSNQNQTWHPSPPVEHTPEPSTSAVAQPPPQPTTPNAKYKVIFCRDILMKTSCPRGETCTFAHTEQELIQYRTMARLPVNRGRNMTTTADESLPDNFTEDMSQVPPPPPTSNGNVRFVLAPMMPGYEAPRPAVVGMPVPRYLPPMFPGVNLSIPPPIYQNVNHLPTLPVRVPILHLRNGIPGSTVLFHRPNYALQLAATPCDPLLSHYQNSSFTSNDDALLDADPERGYRMYEDNLSHQAPAPTAPALVEAPPGFVVSASIPPREVFERSDSLLNDEFVPYEAPSDSRYGPIAPAQPQRPQSQSPSWHGGIQFDDDNDQHTPGNCDAFCNVCRLNWLLDRMEGTPTPTAKPTQTVMPVQRANNVMPALVTNNANSPSVSSSGSVERHLMNDLLNDDEPEYETFYNVNNEQEATREVYEENGRTLTAPYEQLFNRNQIGQLDHTFTIGQLDRTLVPPQEPVSSALSMAQINRTPVQPHEQVLSMGRLDRMLMQPHENVSSTLSLGLLDRTFAPTRMLQLDVEEGEDVSSTLSLGDQDRTFAPTRTLQLDENVSSTLSLGELNRTFGPGRMLQLDENVSSTLSEDTEARASRQSVAVVRPFQRYLGGDQEELRDRTQRNSTPVEEGVGIQQPLRFIQVYSDEAHARAEYTLLQRIPNRVQAEAPANAELYRVQNFSSRFQMEAGGANNRSPAEERANTVQRPSSAGVLGPGLAEARGHADLTLFQRISSRIQMEVDRAVNRPPAEERANAVQGPSSARVLTPGLREFVERAEDTSPADERASTIQEHLNVVVPRTSSMEVDRAVNRPPAEERANGVQGPSSAGVPSPGLTEARARADLPPFPRFSNGNQREFVERANDRSPADERASSVQEHLNTVPRTSYGEVRVRVEQRSREAVPPFRRSSVVNQTNNAWRDVLDQGSP